MRQGFLALVGLLLAAVSVPVYAVPDSDAHTPSDSFLSRLALGVAVGAYQVSDGNLDFGVVGPYPVGDERPSGKMLNIEPRHHVGGNISLRYLVPNSQGFIQSQFHFLKETDAKAADVRDAAPGTRIFMTLLPANFNSGNPDVAALKAGATLRYRYEIGDILYGYFFQSDKGMLAPFMGINYSGLNHQFHVEYTGENIESGSHATIREDSDFSGIGPILGVRGEHVVFGHTDLVGQLAFRFPVGRISSHYVAMTEETESPTELIDIVNKSSANIVPILSAKVALKTEFPTWTQLNGHHTTIALGYEVFRSIETHFASAPVGESNSAAFVNVLNGSGFQGPFVRIEVTA